MLENASDKSSEFLAFGATVRAIEGANMRAAPAQDAPLIGQLTANQSATAIGRLSNNAWILLLEGGWVSADLLHSRFAWDLLEVVPPETNAPADGWIYGPMQAFTFRSGSEDAPCAGAPDSGILMQTPEATTVEILVNGIRLQFDGTLYLQADSSGEMVVSVLEGEIYLDQNTVFSAGKRLQVRREEAGFKLLAAPEDYDYVRARYLPLNLLPRKIELPFSLGGVIQPFVPGTGFLANVKPTDPCVIAWNVDVNIRGGPGPEYPLRQGVPANYSARPDGLANGTDGVLWWRLAEGLWLRSGLASIAGTCLDLPMVEVPPLS
jgi:hypothetical protein